MDRVYFINKAKLVEYGFAHGNIEDDVIINAIFRVQETQLQPAIGTPLFNKLKEEIKAWDSAGSGSGDYYDLMINYILPYLIPATEVRLVYATSTQIANKGTGKNKDEYMETGSVAMNAALVDKIEKEATHFKNQLIKHLCDDNGTKYPEFLEHTGNTEDFKPGKSGPDYKRKISII